MLMAGPVVLVLVGLLTLQATPADFSGEWRLDVARSSQTGTGPGRGRAAGAGPGGGLSLGPLPDAVTIEQGAAFLSVDEHRGVTVSRLTYRTDGTPVDNPMPTGRNRGQSAPSSVGGTVIGL